MDPKQVRVLEDGQASEEDVPRDTSREAVRDQDEGRRTLRARREHSKGDGNFPDPEPSASLDEERPEDRSARDLPKEADDRSAPKGAATKGQQDRDPDLGMRDDAMPRRPRASSGMDRARRAAAPARPPTRARPTARRSSAAKRDAAKRVAKRSGASRAIAKAKTKTKPKRAGATAKRGRATRGAGARSRASRSRR